METIEKYAPQNYTLKAATEREKNDAGISSSERKQSRPTAELAVITKQKY